MSNPIRNKDPYKGFLDKYTSEETINSYSSDFKLFDIYIKGKNPYEATKEELEGFITSMQVAKKADRTIRRRMAALKKFYARAMRLELIMKDPTVIFAEIGTRVPSRNPKALTKEQRDHLKKSLKWIYSEEVKISLMVLLGLHCGLRRNEIRLLKWDDIDFEKKELITIGKGNKEAYIPLSNLLIEKLKENKGTGHIVGDISNATIWYWCAHQVKKWCGWGPEVKFSCHVLRHNFVTELIEMGVDINEVMVLARHANIATTNGYYKLKKGKVQASYSAVFNRKEEDEKIND